MHGHLIGFCKTCMYVHCLVHKALHCGHTIKDHDANVVLEVNHAGNYTKEVLETNEKLTT